MNSFLPIQNKKIGILGAGSSGLAAAELAFKLGANVFVSDFNKKKIDYAVLLSWNYKKFFYNHPPIKALQGYTC